jgi:GDP-D-mannose 3', 5'-epimerase
LVTKLKREGYWVRGVDIKAHEFRTLDTDEFMLLDLREAHNCWQALNLGNGETFDEVYQLAADMGGMGFIHTAECDIMHNSALINVHMIDAAAKSGVSRYFFSSSACVYPDMKPGDPEMTEDQVIPANPDNEYGWEKLYAERMALAYARHYPIEVRVARFQNCYGPYGTWRGGREKAPAAICRKVAMAQDGGTIDVWGDGKAIRGFTFVDDLVDGIYILTQSDLRVPANIGTEQYVTVNDLVRIVIEASGKEIEVQHVEGPVGVLARNFSKARMHALGWEAKVSLQDGIAVTYPWIADQVKQANGDAA